MHLDKLRVNSYLFVSKLGMPSLEKCVHVLKDQVMKGQKSNTDTAKFWTMLMVTTMNQPYVKDLGSVANWDKHEWLDLDSSLELLKNSFASHREQP